MVEKLTALGCDSHFKATRLEVSLGLKTVLVPVCHRETPVCALFTLVPCVEITELLCKDPVASGSVAHEFWYISWFIFFCCSD